MAEINPTIIQFDSEKFYANVVDLMLFNAGVKLTATATNNPQALKLINAIYDKKLKPDIAIVDTFIERDHGDGERLAIQLRKLAPKIKIIAYTILQEDLPWADYTAVKSHKDTSKTIDKALESALGIKLGLGSKLDIS